MIKDGPNKQMQNAMIEAMIAHLGVATTAAKSIGMARSTHYLWMKEDEDYRNAIHDLKEIKKDFVESKLMKLVENGDTAATIFSAKTLLKDRGYIERTEHDINIPTAIRIIRDSNT
jgi:uncharacterized protein YdiU (UPF0061 family)